MERIATFICSTLIAASTLAAGPALAQRGGPPEGRGGGMPDGVGRSGADFPGRGGGIENGGPGSATGRPDWAGKPLDSHTAPRTLDSNPRLAGSLTNALTRSGVELPADGLNAACGGFGNIGQCVAALHVADAVPVTGGFPALKLAMTTGDKLSLGKAIKQLAPAADAKAAERAAKRAAQRDIDAAGEALDD